MRLNSMSSAVIVLLAAAISGPVQGSIITYTTSGIGSGTLGANAFIDQEFAIVVTADTTNVVPTGGGRFAVNNISVTVHLGSSTYAGTFPGSSYIAVPSITTIPPAYAYSQLNVGDDIDTFNFVVGSFGFTGYNPQTSLGPLAVEAFTPYTGTFFGLPTSGGFFSLDDRTSSPDMTFEARVEGVPEPSMFVVAVLMAASGLAIGWQGQARKSQVG